MEIAAECGAVILHVVSLLDRSTPPRSTEAQSRSALCKQKLRTIPKKSIRLSSLYN